MNMNQKKKMKLCAHCDGQVEFDMMLCPYCGNNLSEVKDPASKSFSAGVKKNLSTEETLSSLYPPPYQPKNVSPQVKAIEPEEECVEKTESKPSILIPTLIFSLGINILLFGLYLIFFSSKGEIFLHFNSDLWFVYLLMGAPLSYIGYKMLTKIT
jgi:hypothetical protein